MFFILFMGPARPQTPGHFSRASPARTRVHFCTHKSEPKKRQPPLGWTPAFPQSDLIKLGSLGATEFPQSRWLLVIGAVGVLLRLPALGMIGTSCRAKRIDGSTPLAGRQPKLDKIPGRDQIPEGSAGSVAGHPLSLIKTDWTKDSKTMGFGALLVTFPAREK